MGAASKIEWTDATWPVVKGCDYVSPGCANCYAAGLIHRHASNPNPKISLPLAGLTNERGRWTGKVYLNEPHLADPLLWRKGRMVFVPSHGDLFHEAVPDSFVRKVFGVMSFAGQHTFQVLTKRPERMREFFANEENSLPGCQAEWVVDKRSEVYRTPTGKSRLRNNRAANGTHDPQTGEGNLWPLPNVWLGVSAENQAAADERIPHLLRTPAAVRFLSCEPLLGPVDLQAVCKKFCPQCRGAGEVQNSEEGGFWQGCPCERLAGLGWVIVGGESGTHARPMHPEWARSLREQCRTSGVPFFFKQWGEWGPHGSPHDDEHGAMFPDGEFVKLDRLPLGVGRHHDRRTSTVYRVGKKAAGRVLDGRTWDEFPKATGVTGERC